MIEKERELAVLDRRIVELEEQHRSGGDAFRQLIQSREAARRTARGHLAAGLRAEAARRGTDARMVAQADDLLVDLAAAGRDRLLSAGGEAVAALQREATAVDRLADIAERLKVGGAAEVVAAFLGSAGDVVPLVIEVAGDRPQVRALLSAAG